MGKAEGSVEGYLRSECLRRGWLIYKTQFVAHNGAPDRLILPGGGLAVFVELKSKDGRLSGPQERLHKHFADKGVIVYVVASRAQVDKLMRDLEWLIW